ncbi:MAG TPA: hypothetical protein VNI61_00575 [Gemmatimonadales bacterium]|nr:hypothetical protein [Gemmatimonadales bacterium]
MPRVSAWFVRTALGYLVVGFSLGAWLLAEKGLGSRTALAWALRPAHLEFLLIGWLVQLVMGVALWIFPRFGVPRSAYGSAGLAWSAFVLLNAGVLLVSVAPLLPAGAPLAALGRAIEIAAAAAFAVNLWGRVRPSGLSDI